MIENKIQLYVKKAKNAEDKNKKSIVTTNKKELKNKSCPTDAMLDDGMTKPLFWTEFLPLKMVSIVGQQECVGEKHDSGTSSGTATGTGTSIGSGSGANTVLGQKPKSSIDK
jgi:hypothetical protein